MIYFPCQTGRKALILYSRTCPSRAPGGSNTLMLMLELLLPRELNLARPAARDSTSTRGSRCRTREVPDVIWWTKATVLCARVPPPLSNGQTPEPATTALETLAPTTEGAMCRYILGCSIVQLRHPGNSPARPYDPRCDATAAQVARPLTPSTLCALRVRNKVFLPKTPR
jgi:hypothetical protein